MRTLVTKSLARTDSIQSPALQHGAVGPRSVVSGDFRLSTEAQQVLERAWQESREWGNGAPVDSADLLIGLLACPRTSQLLESLAITEERVRRMKREEQGYEQAGRFASLTEPIPLKTRQMDRIAASVEASLLASESRVIEPEDLLDTLFRDGLGWGVRILEVLALSEPAGQKRLRVLTEDRGAGASPV